MKTLRVNDYLITRPSILKGKSFSPDDKVERVYVVDEQQLAILINLARISRNSVDYVMRESEDVVAEWERVCEMKDI